MPVVGLRRRGALLSAAGSAPFVAGAASAALMSGGLPAPGLWCPFRAATGLPCPFCGASRAFRFAASGDPQFLAYNPFWVVLATAVIAAGVALLLAGERARRWTVMLPRAAPLMPAGVRARWRGRGVNGALLLTLALLIGGWVVALSHRGAITG